MTLLTIQRGGPVRTVSLNRSEKANALNDELLALLLDAFSASPHDDLDEAVRAASASEDSLEGIQALQEKRAPRFKGR